MVVNTKDPWSAFGGFITPGELKSDYLEPGWVQCEVSKKLLCGYERSARFVPVEPNLEVIKWLDKNCAGEWRWFYCVVGGYDRKLLTFLCFEKAQDLFYFRLRF